MALLQYDYPVNTGLAQLGQVLQQGSRDYMGITLKNKADEEARAQRLADLQDARLYDQTQADKGVERQKSLYTWQQQQARVRDLIAGGWLAEGDAADPVKVAAADAKASAEIARKRETTIADEKSAQDYADQLGSIANHGHDRISKLTNELNRIPRAPVSPNPQQIDLLGKQMADSAKADYNNDAIRAQFKNQAERALVEKSQNDFLLAQKAAASIVDSITSERIQLDDVTKRLDVVASRLGKTPRMAPPPASVFPSLSAPAPASLQPAPDTARLGAASGVLGGSPNNPPASEPAPLQSLQNPDFAPSSSIKGVLQRLPAVIPDSLALPGRLIDNAGRYGGAGLQGLWNGNFSVPQTGLLEQTGNAIGDLISPPLQPGDYVSAERAKALNLRRTLNNPLPPLRPISQQTPASVFGNPSFAPGY